MNRAVPTIVIAAPASGSGKTTVATGLLGALRRSGHRVAPFKVGPDYIDPGYHAVAAGRVGRNLDPNLVGAEQVGPLFMAGCSAADIAVVEGVMGLFDGRITDLDADGDALGLGSTAHVATLLGAPVVLVVDAAGHSQSLAALLHGFLGYSPRVRIAGVILNRVGSARHEAVLRQACARVGLAVFGVVHRNPLLAVPSRHLGLIPAAERSSEALAAVDAMTSTVAASVDLPAIVAAASGRAGPLGAPWSAADAVAAVDTGGASPPQSADGSRPVVAIAAGPAFTFGYAEYPELLRAAGAQVVDFDPLVDRLPERTAAVVIGGGFPEEHSAALAANIPLREDIKSHARAGRPIHAECAGLLYLCRELDGHAMAGVIDAVGRFGPRLTLGYRDAVAVSDSTLFDAGHRVTGHEFHRSSVHLDAPKAAWAWRDSAAGSSIDGVAESGVHASYLHVHPAAVPGAIARLVAAARMTSEHDDSSPRRERADHGRS